MTATATSAATDRAREVIARANHAIDYAGDREAWARANDDERQRYLDAATTFAEALSHAGGILTTTTPVAPRLPLPPLTPISVRSRETYVAYEVTVENIRAIAAQLNGVTDVHARVVTSDEGWGDARVPFIRYRQDDSGYIIEPNSVVVIQNDEIINYRTLDELAGDFEVVAE